MVSKNTEPVNIVAAKISPFGARARRKGGSVFALPPAEPIGRKISSDFFKYTPPVGKSEVWLARYAGSPAVFRGNFPPEADLPLV